MRVRGHLDLLRRMDANYSKRNLPHKRFGKPRNKFYTHKCLAIHYANSLHNCRTLQWAQHSSISDTATHSLLVWQTWHINALVSTALQIFNNLNCAWGWKVRVRVWNLHLWHLHMIGSVWSSAWRVGSWLRWWKKFSMLSQCWKSFHWVSDDLQNISPSIKIW